MTLLNDRPPATWNILTRLTADPVSTPRSWPASPYGSSCCRVAQCWGGTRLGGNEKPGCRETHVASWWASIFSMTSGSSIYAMIRTAPPHCGQVSISIPKVRFRRCAQVIEARRLAAVGSSSGCWNSPTLPAALERRGIDSGCSARKHRLAAAACQGKRSEGA